MVVQIEPDPELKHPTYSHMFNKVLNLDRRSNRISHKGNKFQQVALGKVKKK